MKNRFYLIYLIPISLCTIYCLSRSPSVAQTVRSPQEPKVAVPADTLASWVKNDHSAPWKPLKFVKIEVGKPKPIKNWMNPGENNESSYTRYSIYMTAPDLPPAEAASKVDSKNSGWQDFSDLPTKADVTIVQALYRPLPKEPWITLNPDSKGMSDPNIPWDFGYGVTHVTTWTRKGNLLRAEEAVSCPGGGQWKLKVRFRASVNDFFSEKEPSPLWAIEKTFWVETQMPHEGEVEYPIQLHSAWIKGLTFSHSKSGPWKPVPQRGQTGFPLTWAGDKELFIRAEKKYPKERWPSTPQVEPSVELLKDGKNVANVHFYHSYAYPGNYSTFRDSSVFTGLKEISRMVMLTPNMQLGDSEGDQMLTIKAKAGNSFTAPLLLRRRPPGGIYNWAKLQRVVLKWSIGDKNQRPQQQTVYNRSMLPNTTATLKFNTTAIEYPFEGVPDGRYFQQVAQVSLRDASGKLLDSPSINKEGEYQFKIKRAGRYTIHLDVPGPDGQPLHRRADFRKTSLFASDLFQKITVNVREIPLIPIPAGRIPMVVGQWQPTNQTDVWQRTVSAPNANSIRELKFAIRPWAGYKLHSNISWLAPKQDAGLNSAPSQNGTVQYYRVLSTLPDMASRQMNVYDVDVTGKGIDERRINRAEVLE